MVPAIHPLDPEVQRILAHCEDQISVGGSQVAQSYQTIRDVIVDSYPDAAELRAALMVWAKDYRRRAEELRAVTLDDLADQIDISASVFERLLARLRPPLPAPASAPPPELQTGQAWLWQELARRYGPEVSQELHAEYKRQCARYVKERESYHLPRQGLLRYARHRYLNDDV